MTHSDQPQPIARLYAALICATIWLGCSAASPQDAVDAFVAHPMMRHATVGVAVMDLDSRQTVAANAPNQAVVTASTMKVVTSVAALETLGGDFRFITPVTAVGNLNADSTALIGNILITGNGDPTLGSTFINSPDIIDETVNALRSRGIQRVAGCVLADESLFSNVPPYSIHWDVGDLAWDYGTCVYALNYADNLVQLNFTTDRWGRNTTFTVTPNVPGMRIINELRPGKENDIDYGLEYGTPAVVLRGIAATGAHRRTVANPLPAATLTDALTRALRKAGITVDGDSLVLTHAPYRPAVDTLVAHQSPPLTDIVRSLLDRSDNMFAHALLRAIAVHNQAKQPDIDAVGVQGVRQALQQLGVDPDALFMRDGSGLARAGKASPQMFVDLLAAVAQRDYAGERLCTLMPQAGKRIGTLLPKTDLAKQIVLKSGSMTDVQCFVGYFPANNPRYAFAVLVNNYRASRAELKNHIDRLLINLFPTAKKRTKAK